LNAIHVKNLKFIICTKQYVDNKWVPIQNIKRSLLPHGKAKITMPNPQALGSNGFKGEGTIIIFVGELTLLTNGTNLPLVMHVI